MAFSFNFLNQLTVELKEANPKHNNYFIVMPHNDHKTITINCRINSYSLIALPTIDNNPKFWLKLRIVETAPKQYEITDDGYVKKHISHDDKLIEAINQKLPQKIKLSAKANGYNDHLTAKLSSLYNPKKGTLTMSVHGFQELVDSLNWFITLVKSVFAYQIAADNHYYISLD